jgi:hypothetical protein
MAWTLATGVALGAKSARPQVGVAWMPMELLQPIHTLAAMCMLLGGLAALTAIAVARAGGSLGPVARAQGSLITAVVAGGTVAIALRWGSGLEYLTWPRGMTVLPLAVLASVWWTVWRNLVRLSARSPEGAWLLMMGASLAPLGMVERILGSEIADPTRAIMVEWHALDTVLAGINTAMYGLALLLVRASGRGTGLRTTWLYSLAVIALLSTFGHHHYASGQPMTLKWIALGASMLGAVSFARHLAMVIAHSRSRTPVHELVPGVWTVFAVGTGVLLAFPPINQLLHGTHAIVGHAMGSLIGVNVSIILGGLMGAHPSADPDRDRFVRTAWIGATVVLALIVADLVVAGICKGVLRVDGTHREYQTVVRAALVPLPVLGIALSVFLGHLGIVAWRSAAGCAPRRNGPDAQLHPESAGDATGPWPQPKGTP